MLCLRRAQKRANENRLSLQSFDLPASRHFRAQDLLCGCLFRNNEVEPQLFEDGVNPQASEEGPLYPLRNAQGITPLRSAQRYAFSISLQAAILLKKTCLQVIVPD